MPAEKKSSGLERLQLFITVLATTVALVASVGGYFLYERAKKAEEVIQSRLTTQLQALDHSAKSAFNVQSQGSLNVEALSNFRGSERRQFLIAWGVALSNHGNRTVKITRLQLRLYKALLPGGLMFAGELNPPSPPRQSQPVAWIEAGAKDYQKSEPGFEDYAAIGPMSPADRRYGEIRIVLRDVPEAWVFATADVLLTVSEESDRIVEWDYRRLGEGVKHRTDSKSK